MAKAANAEKDLKSAKVYKAKVKYDLKKSSRAKKNTVVRTDHASPYDDYAKAGNALDAAWQTRGSMLWKRKKNHKKKTNKPLPFEVQAKEVPEGEGEFKVEWKLWDSSEKLLNKDVEAYSVMRAERHFIGEKGYRKIVSKYYQPISIYKNGKKVASFTVDDCGVDNIFSKSNDMVFCESKFTRSESKFEDWKNPNSTAAWHSLDGKAKAQGKTVRQMSWEWVIDRVNRACNKPVFPEGATQAELDAIENDLVDALSAAYLEAVDRYLNVFGAAEVPVYPGRYKFKLGERGMLSENELHLRWEFKLEKAEFIELNKTRGGKDFDKWWRELGKKSSE